MSSRFIKITMKNFFSKANNILLYIHIHITFVIHSSDWAFRLFPSYGYSKPCCNESRLQISFKTMYDTDLKVKPLGGLHFSLLKKLRKVVYNSYSNTRIHQYTRVSASFLPLVIFWNVDNSYANKQEASFQCGFNL